MSELDFYNKAKRPWPNPRLTNTAIVGDTGQTSVRLWVRVYAPGEYWIVLAEKPITTASSADPVIESQGQASTLHTVNEEPVILAGCKKHDFGYKSDLTGVFDFSGLKAGITYYYACFSETNNSPWEFSGKSYRFRTQYSVPHKLTFGFYSCNMPYPNGGGVQNVSQWERMETVLDELDADFAIGGGDQVYSDGNKHISIWRYLKKVKREIIALSRNERIEVMKSWYRDIYRGYWGHKQAEAFFARFPQYMIWDDHEIMDGWGSYTDSELARQLNVWWEWDDAKVNKKLANDMRTAAEFVYNEYQHSHNPDTPKGQYDYHYAVAGCSFYVADLRGQRDYNRKTTNKVLGSAQLKRIRSWLESDEVKQASAIFLVVPVPVVHHRNFIVNYMDIGFFGIADDVRDQWEHKSNWVERDKLLAAVFKLSHEQGKTVSILSGDVHVGAAFSLSNSKYPDAKVFQLTSSAITYAKYHGSLLRLIVKDSGELGQTNAAADKYGVTRFNNLCIFEENNFGVVNVKGLSTGELKMTWDLYGASADNEMMVRRGPIKLS